MNKKRLILIAVVVLLIAIIGMVIFIGNRNKGNQSNEVSSTQGLVENGTSNDAKSTEENNTETKIDDTNSSDDSSKDADTDSAQEGDPQGSSMNAGSGAQVDQTALLSASTVAENDHVTLGIDVAKYQGTIDWGKVANAGINFAMIRVGYRTQKTGEVCVDTNAKFNMQEASANGIKIGVYFFSSAVSEEEAIEEADWVADYISQYPITYPVAFDCEGFEQSDSRQNSLTNAQRTDIAIAFMNEIFKKGYTPMFYAARNELEQDAKWDTSRIENSYKIWVSQYPSQPYPDTTSSSYTRSHAMWQYTNQGSVDGIDKPVDLNVAYFGYEGTGSAQDGEAPDQVEADPEALMKFEEVNETVTAKEETNLRNIPSQDTDSQVVATLSNGETVTRTGVSSSGWSRIDYNDQRLYAVSSYLTTDLSYKAPSNEQETGGLKTKFKDCNESVTAKIEVNLRTKPSVTDADSTVAATIYNGDIVVRTGINEEYGWSRVEYNGQTLYCVSSYLTTP